MAMDRSGTKPFASAWEARVSRVFALVSLTYSLSQRKTAKYMLPSTRFERTLGEALMSVPGLETPNFKVLRRNDQYEIRQVEPYFIAETTMPGKNGFDLNVASQSFNVLAEYLFGKVADQDKGKMSFVMPSKCVSDLPLPKDPSVTIKEVPRKTVVVVAISGFVSDEEVKRRESTLLDALKRDLEYRVKEGASAEVAQLQYNSPFTLPFTRRNEIALEVERVKD